MDVLTDVLSVLELKGWVASRKELTPPWRYDFAASHDMIFHLLSAGGGYVAVDGDPTPLRVEDGAVLLLPFGHAHSLSDDLTSPVTQFLHLAYTAECEFQSFRSASEMSKMVVLCGAFRLEHPGAFPLLHSLPKVIHIPAEQGRTVPGFAEIVQLIAREAAAPRLGAEVMRRRLTELLFIHVIRVWVEQQAASSRGWLAALRDPPISAALGLMHQSPQHRWKVEELAAAVGLSRAVFSARFTRLVGEPPLAYLTQWRMQRATRLLKDNVAIEKIAKLLGYDSAVAFRKAFKREVGVTPATYRKLG